LGSASFATFFWQGEQIEACPTTGDRSERKVGSSSLGFSDGTRHDGGPRAFFDHHPAAAFIVLEICPIAFPRPGDRVVAKRGLATRHDRCGRADHRVCAGGRRRERRCAAGRNLRAGRGLSVDYFEDNKGRRWMMIEEGTWTTVVPPAVGEPTR
jgi:hypothetical protein